MITRIKGNPYIIVTLDANKSLDRTKDAKRIFTWLASEKVAFLSLQSHYLGLIAKPVHESLRKSKTIFGPS